MFHDHQKQTDIVDNDIPRGIYFDVKPIYSLLVLYYIR